MPKCTICNDDLKKAEWDDEEGWYKPCDKCTDIIVDTIYEQRDDDENNTNTTDDIGYIKPGFDEV